MPKSKAIDVPSFSEYMQPTLDALRERGGAVTISELLQAVLVRMGLTAQQTSLLLHGVEGTRPRLPIGWPRHAPFSRERACLAQHALPSNS